MSGKTHVDRHETSFCTLAWCEPSSTLSLMSRLSRRNVSFRRMFLKRPPTRAASCRQSVGRWKGQPRQRARDQAQGGDATDVDHVRRLVLLEDGVDGGSVPAAQGRHAERGQ